VDAVASRVGERYEGIGLLVNNAGIPARGSFFDLPAERIDEVTRTNYLGSIWATRAFLPLLEHGAPAHVVNVVSVAGTVAYGPSGPYAASKHAQIAFSRNAAAELLRRGIHVHAILPGPVETDGFPQRDLLASPLGRRVVVSPEHVADAVVRAVENGRTETFVPAGWRAAALAAAIAPRAMARLAAHRRGRR